MDRQARLRLAGWRSSDLLGPVCAHLGADPAAVLAGSHRPAESAARALIAHVACDGAGTPAVTVAGLLGVSGAAVARRACAAARSSARADGVRRGAVVARAGAPGLRRADTRREWTAAAPGAGRAAAGGGES